MPRLSYRLHRCVASALGVGVAEGEDVAVGGIDVQGSPVQTADRHDRPTAVCGVADRATPCTEPGVVSDKVLTGAGGETRLETSARI